MSGPLTALIVVLSLLSYAGGAAVVGAIAFREFKVGADFDGLPDIPAFFAAVLWPIGWAAPLAHYLARRPTPQQKAAAQQKAIRELEADAGLRCRYCMAGDDEYHAYQCPYYAHGERPRKFKVTS